MDIQRMNAGLNRFFQIFVTARYQGVVMTVKSQHALSELGFQVKLLLPDRDVWESPGRDGAPSIPCARRDFNHAVLSKRPRGLIIFAPQEWMIDWPEQDKANFWSGVADSYGRHSILILDVETPLLARQLGVGFQRYALPQSDLSVWISQHQPINGLQETLS